MISILAAVLLHVTPVTLGEVRAEARSNPQAMLSALDYARSLQGQRSQRAFVLPQVSLGATGGYEWTGTQAVTEPTTRTDPVTGQPTGVVLATQDVPPFKHPIYQFTATLSQVLFDWGRFKAVAQAGSLEDAARAQAEEQAQFAEYEALRRFYVLLTAQRSQDVFKANARRSREQVERAHAFFETARGTKGDVLASQINLNNDEIASLRQGSTVTQAQADLAAWLGRTETEELEAVDPGTLEAAPGSVPELQAIVAQAHANRPLLQVVDAQLKAAEQGVSSAVGGYLPRVKLLGNYQRNGNSLNPTFTTPHLQNDVQALINFQWDIFSGLSTDAAVKSAEASVSSARITAEQTRRDVEGSLRIGHNALTTLIRVADVSRETQSTARKNLSYAQDRFTAGAASTLDVRDAQLKLTQAELNFLQSRADVEVARAALARLSGTLNSGVKP